MRYSVLLLAVALGCSAEAAVARESIRDGELDATSSAVVGIYDDATASRCTGALIAPDLVLTARHCVAPVIGIPSCADDGRFGAARPPSTFYVTTRPTLAVGPSDFRAVREIVIPPGTDSVCGGDVALLVLVAAVPGSEATPIAPRLGVAPTIDEPYSAVGYGAIDDVGTGADERRRRDGLRVACVGAACPGAAGTEWIGEAGVCQGDSGGPALDASGEVIGVASRGAIGCVSPVYAALASYAPWLRAEGARAATRGGYPEPAWVTDGPVLDAAAPDAGAPDVDAAVPSVASDAGAPADAAHDAALDAPPGPSGGCAVLPGRRTPGVALALALAALCCCARRPSRRAAQRAGRA